MAKKTTKRRTWTKENVRTLKVLAQKKKRAASIAKSLRRTESATRQKACSLGLSLDTRSRKAIPSAGEHQRNVFSWLVNTQLKVGISRSHGNWLPL